MNPIIREDFQTILSVDLDWDYFSGKTILVTGASGMLAFYIIGALLYLNRMGLLKDQLSVIGLVRDLDRANKRYEHIQGDDLQLVKQDLSENISVAFDADVIIHAASQASPKHYGVDPVGTILPNVIGTSSLLNLAKEKGLDKFLFISSAEVYGIQRSAGLFLDENAYGSIDPTNIRSCYAAGKLAGEAMCFSYGYQYGIDVRVVRPFHTYGPGMMLGDGRVFADFVRNIVNDENVAMRSAGKQKRPFCYILDAVVGVFHVLLKGSAQNAYNIANPDQIVSIEELANILIGLYPEKGLRVDKTDCQLAGYIQSEIGEQRPDITKLQELGWQPVVTIEQGFDRTIRSYM